MQSIDLEKQSLTSTWIPSPAVQLGLPITTPTPKPPWHFRFTLRRLLLSFTLLCSILGILHWKGVGFGSLFPSWDRSSTASIESINIPHLISWGQNLSSSALISGLTQISSNRTDGESVYHLGLSLYPDYPAQIDKFISVIFPPHLQALYEAKQLDGGIASAQGWDENTGRKTIWQTDKDEERVDSGEVKNWREGPARNEGWEWRLLLDDTATEWVKQHLAGTRLELLWDNLPSGILKADLLRYLLLTIEGGIYSDTDTLLLKSPSQWGHGADLWKNGQGWMKESDIIRLGLSEGISDEERDKEVDRLIGRAKIVVGIEADVGDREDWARWWPRPLQIVQWTIASAPYHPIMISAIIRVLQNTATAIDFAQSHYTNYTSALEKASSRGPISINGELDLDLLKGPTATEDREKLERLGELNVLTEPIDGGPLGVINWTGPSVFTDSVLSYLLAKYGMVWQDLKDLRRPLRVGDVLILPVTGFSPGVGNFGAGTVLDEQAMVEHRFRGSWKNGG